MPLLAPDGTVDRIKLTARSPSAFRLDLQRVPAFFIFGSVGVLSRLHIYAPATMHQLTIGDAVFDANGHVVGEAPNGSVELDFRNHKVWHVELTHGTWALPNAGGVHGLRVGDDVELRAMDDTIPQVEIVGSPMVKRLRAEFLRTVDGAMLDGHFLTVALEASGLVQLRGSLETQRVTAQGIVFDRSGGREPAVHLGGNVQGLSFAGGGEVTTKGEASKLRFGPSPGDVQGLLPSLTVTGLSNVDLEGELDLLYLVGKGQTLRAGPSGLRCKRIEGGEHAEIDQVDPYQWLERDIRSLQSCTRFTPRLAATALARRRAELAMNYASEDEAVRRRRAIGFWSRLAALLAEQHAPAAVQSDVHVAAMRARRRGARPWSREWLVLHAYALIGYGDRFLQPFAWFFLTGFAAASALTLIGAVDQQTGGIAGFIKLALRVLDAPLALFRLNVPAPPNFPGMWDTAIWTAATIINAVLIGFMVLALRRTTRLGRE